MPTAKKAGRKPTTARKSLAKSPPKANKKPPRKLDRSAARPEPVGDTPNPFSPLHWPVTKGQKVYYITSEMQWGGGKIASGTVVHYNPALVGNSVVTKGQPVVTIDPAGGEGGIGNIATVGAADVADFSPDGRLKLEATIRARLLARADELDRQAADARREAHTLLHDPKKPKKGNRP